MVIRQGKSQVTFVFKPANSARQVAVVGTFNNWDPAKGRMRKSRDGSYRKRVNLQPGTYEYKFLVDGCWFVDPDAEAAVPNPFGDYNSVLNLT